MEELYQMALYDGYAENDIIRIAEKESGIKLSEEERAGLNRMKELIETVPEIDTVYCWEVSRIARRKKINFSVLEYLESRRIQLIVKEPYLKLLNPDGTVNDAAETVFTLFAQMAESEMRSKLVRWKRTKTVYSKHGQYSGGRIKFGYHVVNGKIEEFTEEADMVRTIFDLYAESKQGMVPLYREMKERGIRLSLPTVNAILRDKAYTGFREGMTFKDGRTLNPRKFPRIISDEQWNLVAEKRGISQTKKDKTRKHWFGSKLVICDVCGRHYIANAGCQVYSCIQHSSRATGERCPNSRTISINVLDSILWDAASDKHKDFLLRDHTDRVKKYAKEIKAIDEKLKHLNMLISDVTKKKKRVADMYVRNVYNEQEMEHELEKIDNQNSENINKHTKLSEDRKRLENLCNAGESSVDAAFMQAVRDNVELSSGMLSNAEMDGIVKQHVKEVHLSDDIDKNGKVFRKIEIIFFDGCTRTYIVQRNQYTKNHKQFMCESYEGQGGIRHPSFIEILHRTTWNPRGKANKQEYTK